MNVTMIIFLMEYFPNFYVCRRTLKEIRLVNGELSYVYQTFELFNGVGGLVEGSIQNVDKNGSDVELLENIY